MNLSTSFFLGILQGLTEFLPVSSSGHLVLAQNLIPGFTQPGVLFDVVLHGGTLLAIVIYFRKTLLKITRRYIVLLAIATIPAVISGFVFQSDIENLFQITKLVGIALLLTAFFNYLTDRGADRGKTVRKIGPFKGLSLANALLIGFFQALAIIPGISRSGATIFAGTTLGIDKEKAAEFSFLLSIPAVFGANLLQLMTHGIDRLILNPSYLIGFVAAFISGYITIRWVINLLLSKKFKYFALYCLVAGGVTILFL